MTLFARISRMFKADIHGILDSIEEPEVILKQAVREMEQEIEKSEQQLTGKKARKEYLQKTLSEKQEAIAELEKQISLCFEAKNEELAKGLVRKKLECKQRTKLTEQAIHGLETEVELSAAKLAEQKDKLQSIVEKMKIFSATAREKERNNQWQEPLGRADFHISDQDVEVAFLEEKKRRAA
jgi:phage shock protein A